MFVAGKDVHVLAKTGRTASVQAYDPSMQPVQLDIIDCAVLYESSLTGRKVLMIVEGAIYSPTMDHNLVPPFMLREAGVVVDTTPKCQANSPNDNHHSLYWPGVDLRIPLQLLGIFSYFPTRVPTQDELNDESIPVIRISPEGPWDPNSELHALNENNLLDSEGHVIREPTQQPEKFLLEDVPLIDAHVASVTVSSAEVDYINNIADMRSQVDDYSCTPAFGERLSLDNQGHGPTFFDSHMATKDTLTNFMAAIGSCHAFYGDILFPEYEDEQNNNLLEFEQYVAGSATAVSTKGVDAEHLSKIWRVDRATAERTIDVTSQRCVRSSGNEGLVRNYGTNDRMLRYRRINQHFFMDTFFATKKIGKSTRGNTCCQLFVTDKGFVYVIPMRFKRDLPAAIRAFAKAVGAPDTIICDHAKEQVSKEVKGFLNKIGTTLKVLEEGTPWANRAELYIGLIKEAVRKDMQATDSPLNLWDYCVERRARVNNLTAGNMLALTGRNPHFHTFNDEGDISNLCQFDWYEWVYFRDQSAGFPNPKECLGRCLGPATGEGNEMTQWILKSNGQVVPRRSVRPLSQSEKFDETQIAMRSSFTMLIKENPKLSGTLTPQTTIKDQEQAGEEDNVYVPYEDDSTKPWTIPDVPDPVDSTGRAIDQQPAYDKLIHVELMLPQNGEYQPAKVVGRAKNELGVITGNYDENPIMNTIMYEVEFPDGQVKQYAANIIAENLLNQVDDEGYTITRIDCILDHEKSLKALNPDEMYTVNKQGVKRIRKTTEGWRFKVRWHDKSEQWVPLSILKESNPVDVAIYAKARGIDKEPALAWWVPYTLKKREVIVAAVKARTRKMTHKYGIKVPRSIQEAYAIDAKNGNDFWAKAIKKEMSNVGIAFKILTESKTVPPGWTKVTGHLVFDVKMSLQRKARWVLDGHLTPDVDYSTYAGVVSRESVRIALTYAALNGLDVWTADIKNAYIQAPSSRKDYIICGPEFGLENVGTPALITRALYGGKTAGADFRKHLRDCMKFLKFTSCRADPDVWMRAAVDPDRREYWEYVLLYTDDCLVVSHRGQSVLTDEIGKYFEMKQESIAHPDIYLGGKLRKVELENGVFAWAFGSSQYVQAAVANVENYLREHDANPLPPRCTTPLSPDYRPEIDTSQELCPRLASHYMSMIGVLRWIVELGRVDICCEVSMMSSHLALPRVGHLREVYRIFGYLKSHHNAEMVFDPTVVNVDDHEFRRRDWSSSEMDSELEEPLPNNMPQPRGLGFKIRAYVDADHATDSMTRRSRSGFLVYLNNAPVHWMSKKQTSVETSSYGSEFVAMKLCCEYVRGLRYKLRMMGISLLDEPAYIYGDNKSVLANTTIPDSTLKKKSHSITYHFVREGVARDEWRTSYVNTHDNPADLLTKPLSGMKRRNFVRMILYHIYSYVT